MGHQAAASGYEDCNQDDCPADIGQQLPHEQGDVMAAKMKVNAHNVAVSVALPQHPRSEVPVAYASAPVSLAREISQIASEGIRKEGNRSERNVAPFSILRIPCRVILARLASSRRDIRAAFRRALRYRIRVVTSATDRDAILPRPESRAWPK